MGKTDTLSHRSDHGTGSEDNDNMVLLTPNFFAVRALEGLETAGEEQGILKDIQKGTRDGEKEELVARAARELQGSPAHSVKSAEWSITDGLLYFQGKIYVPDMPPISIVGSSCFIMTLGWLVTVEDGSHWNWCLGTTGGPRCQGMLAGTSPPVTCAFGPNHSDVL